MLRRAMPVLFGLAVACSVSERAVRDHHEDGNEQVGTTRSALSPSDPVSAAVTDSACTTTLVKALATQLIEEIQCMRPGTFASIDNVAGLTLNSAVFPWLQEPAQRALIEAQKERGVTMTLNSALRTLPQQYLLYRWYKTGRCGIGLAAAPGNSNHEEGLAVDIADNASWRTAMKNHSFIWLGSGDPVHFDYKGEGAVDISGLSVLAFQRLWNRNHPEDEIEEDSKYGPATEERLASAPVGGFPKGPDCSEPPPDASVPPPAPGPTPTPARDAGTDDSLEADGERPDTDSEGCAMGRTTTTAGWPAALGVLVVAAAIARARRRQG